jgi:RimJ/RimL family protein N-acetyltransferase
MRPTLETERLILRPPEQADFDAGWAEFHGDEACMRYLGGPMARSLAWRALAQVAGMWSLLGFGQFSAVEKDTGRWVGRVGPWRPDGWPAPEVGWMFRRSAWGRGYATEAAAACLDFAFGELGWTFAGHMIHPDNQASQAVARKLGSTLIGEVRLPPPMDAAGPAQMWGQTAEAWAARGRPPSC